MTHAFKRDRRGGINLSDPHNVKIMQELECQRWLADHPGHTAAKYRKLLNEPWERNKIKEWRIATAEAEEKAMRQAWLRDHPGNPLCEHLCGLSKTEYAEYLEWLQRYGKCQWAK
jgi:hypothetical protein